MSKIVICSREWSGSTGRYARALVEYLEQIDDQNEYIVLVKPADVDSWQPSNPNVTLMACPHKEFSFDEQIGLKRQLESLQPDLVHFTMVQQPVLYRGKVVTTMQDLTTLRFRNPAKNPVIFTIKQQVYKWVNRQVAARSAAIITPTQFVKDDIVNFTGVSPDKITVTHESADTIPAASEPVAGLESTRFLMYVGRPTPHKNLPRLIAAFRDLQSKHPDLRLVLAGKKDANYRQIEQDVQEQGIANVIFTDFVSEGQLRWLYEHCAAYVFPSLSEGFGLPGLEAMRHSAPVVSSNATCLPEVYGDAAHYFDPLDVGSISNAIDDVLVSDDLRQQLIARGTDKAAEYSWKRMAEQTRAVYQTAFTASS